MEIYRSTLYIFFIAEYYLFINLPFVLYYKFKLHLQFKNSLNKNNYNYTILEFTTSVLSLMSLNLY